MTFIFVEMREDCVNASNLRSILETLIRNQDSNNIRPLNYNLSLEMRGRKHRSRDRSL